MVRLLACYGWSDCSPCSARIIVEAADQRCENDHISRKCECRPIRSLGRPLKQRGGLCWKREFGGILKLGRAAMRLREIGVSTALASAAVAALIFVNGGV
jgi:hypothetical protein